MTDAELSDKKNAMRIDVFKEYANAMQLIFDNYPIYEDRGWFIQMAQAWQWVELVQAGDQAAIQAAIDSIVSPYCQYIVLFRVAICDRDPTIDDLTAITDKAGLILYNSVIFQHLYGRFTGYKSDLLSLIDTLSIDNIDTFDIDFGQFLGG